jgi:hypothetical protein
LEKHVCHQNYQVVSIRRMVSLASEWVNILNLNNFKHAYFLPTISSVGQVVRRFSHT